MPNYTVTTVQKQEREPEIQGKVFHSYLLGILDHASKVELLQNPSSPPPTEGEVIEGAIVMGKEKNDGTRWPDKLKKISKQQGFRSPKESASIVRQHSQEMALRYATFLGEPVSLPQVKDWTDWFQADANGSSEAPTEAPKATREAVPMIPKDRAEQLREAAKNHPAPQTVKAKLVTLGVQNGRIDGLDVDSAEAFEAWLKEELS